MTDVINQFRQAIIARGMVPPEEIPAGQIFRFSSNGKPKDTAGWGIVYTDGIPYGVFGDWRGGWEETWKPTSDRAYTQQEIASHKEKIAATRKAVEAERERLRGDARKRAQEIYNRSQPCVEHPYLTVKGIGPHGARVYQTKDNSMLVIRVVDEDGLQSLQLIDESGKKRFLHGGKIGGCYSRLGPKPEESDAICIVEGFATGATVREATGYSTAVAFNAGNLVAVAKAMRRLYPDKQLIVCADDDYATDGNPGLTKGMEAANLVGARLVLPTFPADRDPKATDFNDMYRLCGLDAVREAIVTANQEPKHQAVTAGVTEVTRVPVNIDVIPVAARPEHHGVREVTDFPPPAHECPKFVVLEDWAESGGRRFCPGLYHVEVSGGEPRATWISSPIYVDAITYDSEENNFGRLLRFRNSLGTWRIWSMPMEMTSGSGDLLRSELLAMGMEISTASKQRNLLSTYLQSEHPNRRVRCATTVGWCEESFVLPDEVIGAGASNVIFQSGERGHEEYKKRGSAEGWKMAIGMLAPRNPLLLFAISSAFVGPMLSRCNSESGGVHFVGDSSTGKTTLLEAACSVWGGPNYRRSWRTTSNGLEGAAALFNDNLLALDEISECDPRDVGAIVYALGNGRGKQRAGRSGNARAVTRWRCFVCSSGERTIATTMLEGGCKVKAGQGVRMLDIPAARRFGAWDDLHGFSSGTEFSDTIKRAAVTEYGHAGRAFLQKLTRDTRDFCAMLDQFKNLELFSTQNAEGQDKRAAARFALIAVAGELATEYGITGWQEGEAVEAASVCFRLWQAGRGTGNDERRQILEKLDAFIEKHGDSRFSNAAHDESPLIRDRAGWWADTQSGRKYLFTSAGFREALIGFDFNRTLDQLESLGVVPRPGADGKRSQPVRIGGRTVRVYTVDPEKLSGDDHGA